MHIFEVQWKDISSLLRVLAIDRNYGEDKILGIETGPRWKDMGRDADELIDSCAGCWSGQLTQDVGFV